MEMVRSCLLLALALIKLYSSQVIFQPGGNVIDYKGCTQQSENLQCYDEIPKVVPASVKHVTLQNVNHGQPFTNGTFKSASWGTVLTLEILQDFEFWSTVVFESDCFHGLTNVEQLHIHSTSPVTFASNTFSSLSKLTLLDLSRCLRTEMLDVILGFPNVQTLNISMMNSVHNGIALDDQFFKVLYKQKIAELVVTATQINTMNTTSLLLHCGHLKSVNLSRSRIHEVESNIDSNEYATSELCALKEIDLSYVTFPTSVADPDKKDMVYGKSSVFIDLDYGILKLLNSLEYLDAFGILNTAYSSFTFNNVFVLVSRADWWHFKEIRIGGIHLVKFNVTIVAPKSTLETFIISDCGCEYIHPNMFVSFNDLKYIDLSKNKLFKMMEKDELLFEKMFSALKKIETIILAENMFKTLPEQLFASNNALKVLDLSYNKLSEISFDMTNLTNLKLLVLKGNEIKVLNYMSLNRLNGLINLNPLIRIDFSENNLICSRCDALEFIRWFKKSKGFIFNYSSNKCLNSNDELVSIDDKTQRDIVAICDAPTFIAIACVASVTMVVVLVTIILIVRRYIQKTKYRNKMERNIRLLQEGNAGHEFAVYLAYSSMDEDFVQDYVSRPLNAALQNAVGVERELVAEGDRYFRLGRSLPDEISRLMERASVIVAVLSDNFIQSVHCRNEFDQAFMLEKPLVLMIKGHVNIELMPSLMRDIYNKRTRVHWHYENGEYTLKSTWANVCTSIIELVKS